jgi:hypothetical protein
MIKQVVSQLPFSRLYHVFAACACKSMLAVKKTRLQIQQRAARDIKRRTEDRTRVLRERSRESSASVSQLCC